MQVRASIRGNPPKEGGQQQIEALRREEAVFRTHNKKDGLLYDHRRIVIAFENKETELP